MTEEKDAANPRIDLFVDEDGKHRWRFWRSSDIVGASSQGYADRGDRDDNLCEVMGGTLLVLEEQGVYLARESADRPRMKDLIPVREAPRG